MSEQTHGAAGSPIDDDTLIRPMGAFYDGQPPAPANSAPAATPAPANQAPTLAERLMRRLPAPPEKAQARQQYEQRQRQAEAQRMRELEELRRADAERAAARQPAPAVAEAPAHGATAPGRPAAHAAQARPVQAAAATNTAVRAAVPAGAAAATPATAVVPAMAGTGQLEPTATATGPAAAVASRAARRTRKARLRVARIDPWSVMKTFFLFAIAGGIAFVTFVALMYTLVDGSGLFDQIDEMVNLVFGTQNDNTPFDIRSVAGMERVLGISALLACINVVILTALATLGSFLYNLSATMLGGLELTLAED